MEAIDATEDTSAECSKKKSDDCPSRHTRLSIHNDDRDQEYTSGRQGNVRTAQASSSDRQSTRNCDRRRNPLRAHLQAKQAICRFLSTCGRAHSSSVTLLMWLSSTTSAMAQGHTDLLGCLSMCPAKNIPLAWPLEKQWKLPKDTKLN